MKALRADNEKWQRAAGHWKAQHEVTESRLSEVERERNELRDRLAEEIAKRVNANVERMEESQQVNASELELLK